MSAVPMDSLSVLDLSSPAPLPVQPARPRVWPVFALWFAAVMVGNVVMLGYMIVLAVAVAVTATVHGLQGADLQLVIQAVFSRPVIAVLVTILPFQMGMILVTLLVARLSKEPREARLGLLPSVEPEVGGMSLAMFAAFTISSGLAITIALTMLMAKPATTSVAAAVQEGWLGSLVVGLVLGIVPPIVEEIIFRGYIQRRLLQRWSPVAAIGMTTFLFAILHFDSLQHIVAVIPLGLVTGVLAYRTKSVKPGMIVHAIHNFAAVGYTTLTNFLAPQMTDETLGLVLIATIATLFVLGLPATIGLFRSPRINALGLRLLPKFGSTLRPTM